MSPPGVETLNVSVGCEFSWFSSDASDWELGSVRLPGPLSAFYMIQPSSFYSHLLSLWCILGWGGTTPDKSARSRPTELRFFQTTGAPERGAFPLWFSMV